MDYLLLTPVRNEFDTLPTAAAAVESQIKRPLLWLILDDGSTDGTLDVAREIAERHPWAFAMSAGIEKKGRLGRHFAELMRLGFSELLSMADEKGLHFECIGKIDADVTFSEECFSALLEEFEKNPSLGIASPRLLMKSDLDQGMSKGPKKGHDVAFSDHPTDGVRVYRMACYEDIGGLQLTRAPETVAEAKADMRGWKLERVDGINAYALRDTHVDTSVWSRWEMHGSESWYLGSNPAVVAGRFVMEVLVGAPRHRAVAYLAGYLKALVRREDRIDDRQVLNYFMYIRPFQALRQAPDLLGRICRSMFADRHA